MTALQTKLIRDLAYLRTQAVAIALVIGCGVATFVMSVSVLRSLERTRDRYYDDFRFAQLFVQVKRAPRGLAERLAEIPGVAAVQTRVVAELSLDLDDMAEAAVGRMVSIPDFGEPALNRLHLRRGRMPDPERRGEVLVNEAFALAHRLEPGDRLRALLNGRREELTVVGVALSPEYIYQIRAGDLFPDDRRFGVFWMRERPLAAAFDLTEAFNDASFALMHGAVEPEVIRRIDDLLAPYGGLGAVGRADQVSHRYVSDELAQLRAMASVPPAIFLLVAAFVLNVVLNRVIATQREQIAALKAFGYTPAELGWHFGQLALLIVLAGVAIGAAVGGWLGGGLAEMYGRFFRFARMDYRLDPAVVLLAGGFSVLAGAFGVTAALWRVMRLPAAEAMRPEAPARYRVTWLERTGLLRRLSQVMRMAVRQIERHPLRAALSTLGVALGVAVMILGSFTRDVVNYIIDFQFGAVQHYDYTITLYEPAAPDALPALARLPGVLRAEPYRAVPVRLAHGRRTHRAGLLGLAEDRELLQLRDTAERVVAVPADGLLLSEALARLLDVRRGDVLQVQVLEGSRPVRSLAVTDTLRDFSGLSAYMDLAALNRFMREGRLLSGAFLRIDPAAEARLHARLKATPRVAGASSQHAALRGFQDTLSENLLRMRLFNVAFAGIIAFGVVYNAARITLSERARELATLRVIGLTRAEVSGTLLGEVALLTLAALPLGLGLGRLLAGLAVKALETETQRFPLVVASSTYAAAAVTVLAAALVSGLVVRRRIDGLDLVAVLKSRD
ncbi:MAG: FtsX-like permease family protein [Opitutaceae bacterium]|nr:FtsX-like permease family protein [Opitutaceae bacterium]